MSVRNVFIWLRTGTIGELSYTQYRNSAFQEMRVISSLTGEAAASYEGLCCRELRLCEQRTDCGHKKDVSPVHPNRHWSQLKQYKGLLLKGEAAGE